MNVIRLGLFGIALTFSAGALAQDAGWFVGAGMGRAAYASGAGSSFTGGPVVSSDNHDLAQQIMLGYRLNRWLALVGSYVDFGRRERLAAWPADLAGVCQAGVFSPCNGKVKQTTRAMAYTLVLEGALPLSREIDLFAQAGLARTETRNRYSDGTGSSLESQQRETRAIYGLGTRYRFASGIAVKMEWNRLGREDRGAEQPAVDFYSFGLEYGF